MKIVLVDDDEIIRIGMKKMISKDVGDVVAAEFSNGLDALNYVQQTPDINIIITDIRMPLMDGLELIEKVKEIRSDIRFIVLSGFDEFNYIRRAFKDGVVDYFLKPINRQELITHIRKIEEEINLQSDEEKFEKLRKETFLADTLRKAVAYDLSAVEQFRKQTQMEDGAAYIMLTMEIGFYYKPGVKKQELLNNVAEMKTMFQECMQDNGFHMALFTEQNSISGFILLKDESNYQTLCRCCQAMLDDLKQNLLLCIGMSEIHTELNEIHTAYEQAQEAVSFRFYMGNNKLFCYKDICDRSVDFEYDVKRLANELSLEMALMDYPKVREKVNQFFLDISFLKPEKIRMLVRNTVYILAVKVNGFEKALNYSGVDYEWMISNIGTYNELKEYLLLLLKGCIQSMSREKEQKRTDRIEMAKTYIAEHYMEQLSLNDVAEYVELNPSYFSKLFKSEMDLNFSEYLMKVRMEKAMQLLRNPKVRIYEIGGMVGYEDAVSFGRAFKKFVGMSPKEYRNTVY